MTVRNIKKNLAGAEDLLHGIGVETQSRGGALYDMHKLDTYVPTYDVTEMQRSSLTFMRLYGTDTAYTDYRRNPTGTVGIPSELGGVWEPIRSSELPVCGSFIYGAYVFSSDCIVGYNDSFMQWQGDTPKEVAAGATPATSGGIGAGAWVDRSDYLLRQDLASNTGSGLVGTMYGPPLSTVIGFLLTTGSVVKASAFSGLSTDTAIFTAMLTAAEDINGYHSKTLVNDLGRPLSISQRYEIRSHNNPETLTDGSTSHVELYGDFELSNGGGFDFYKCRNPKVYVNIYEGGGNSLTDLAVRFEGTCLGVYLDITGTQYAGRLFGTLGTYNSITAQGISQCLGGRIIAHGGGGAFNIKNTTGFGQLDYVWESLVVGGSIIEASYDVTIVGFENIITNTTGNGKLGIYSSGCKFGMLATGAWGTPQVEIWDSTVQIDKHLCVAGNYPTNTINTYAMDIFGDSCVVDIAISEVVKAGSGYKVGHSGTLRIGICRCAFLQNLVEYSNDPSYGGINTGTGGWFEVSNLRAFRCNPVTALSTMPLINVESDITIGVLKIAQSNIIDFNYNRTSNYSYTVRINTSSTSFLVYIDNTVETHAGPQNPFKLYNVNTLRSFKGNVFKGEINYNSVTSTGNGHVVDADTALPGNTTGMDYTYTGEKPVTVRHTITIASSSFSVLVNSQYVYQNNVAGSYFVEFKLRKGDIYRYTYTGTTITGTNLKLVTE